MTGKREEKISSVELWAAKCLFIASVAMTAPVGTLAGQHSWIAVIIGILIGLVFAWVYTYLSDMHPGKSIVEISNLLLGKWGGKVIGLLYAWWGLEVSAFILKDNWQLTLTVALPSTPLIVIAIISMIFVVWLAYEGIETICRLSIIFLPILALYLLIAFILLSKDFDFRNFLPITDVNWRKLLYSSFQAGVIPFGGAAIFVVIFPCLNKKSKALKPSLLAVSGAGLLLLVSNIIYILVLGPLAPKLTYPGYTAFSYIQVADFIDRAEILVYTLFITMNIIEMSISLYVAAFCFSKFFGIGSYRVLLVPLGILVVEMSTFIVHSHSEHISIIAYSWPWYAAIYEFVIPLLLLILSAVSKKVKRT